MRNNWLVFFGGLCAVTHAWGVSSYEGTLISNPPQPPLNCKTLRDTLSLTQVHDASGDLYYFYKCLKPRNNSKYFRIWRVRVEESKPGEIPVNPIRIISEVVLPYPKIPISEIDLYPCAVKNEFHMPAIAILPSQEPIVDDATIKKAVAAWRVAGDTLEKISPTRIAWCVVNGKSLLFSRHQRDETVHNLLSLPRGSVRR